ncbi:putative adhesin MafB, truncated [Neisseria gonorrhoeae]|uniref:Putative adhesin MafB, truncated n=1 Tax=Neisseria gonorrhoeae TaxID=485 RepID=A0A378W1D8_NEIGO|nr:putative adhesin MafB, truncated [Neisseria gonorrhoeae]
MNLPIQKFMMLFAAAISLLQIPISHANGLDARLRDDMQAKHYEPGGKYHLFGNGRGSVKIGFAPSKHLMQLRSAPYCLLHTNGQGLKVLSVMKPIFQGTDTKYTVRSIIMIQKALLISAAA